MKTVMNYDAMAANSHWSAATATTAHLSAGGGASSDGIIKGKCFEGSELGCRFLKSLAYQQRNRFIIYVLDDVTVLVRG